MNVIEDMGTWGKTVRLFFQCGGLGDLPASKTPEDALFIEREVHVDEGTGICGCCLEVGFKNSSNWRIKLASRGRRKNAELGPVGGYFLEFIPQFE